MYILTAQEVVDLHEHVLTKTAEVVTEYAPRILEELGLDIEEEDMDIVIMPVSFLVDEFDQKVLTMVEYDDDDMPYQIQISGVWTASTEDDYSQLIDIDNPLYTQSLVVALASALIEATAGATAVLERLDLREAAFSSGRSMAAKILGAAWVGSVEDKEALN